MKLFKYEELLNIKNPHIDGSTYRPEVLTKEHNASSLGGMLGILPPNTKVPYHYHKTRESIIIILFGKGLELVEGKEFNINKGDILFIPALEKHSIINNSSEDLKFIEYFTNPPLANDFYNAI